MTGDNDPEIVAGSLMDLLGGPDEIAECIVTAPMMLARLEELEQKLAERWDITDDVEENIYLKVKDAPEDELVFEYIWGFDLFVRWVRAAVLIQNTEHRDLLIEKGKKYKTRWEQFEIEFAGLEI